MEDLLASLTLPALAVFIVIGTVVLSRLDARSRRKIIQDSKAERARLQGFESE
jgi:hypothetical protein